MDDAKRCMSCNRMLPLACFGKRKRGRNGLNSQCRDCTRAYYAEWRTANREKANGYARKWKTKHPHAARESDRRSKAKNREANRKKHAARQRHYVAANREQVYESNRRSYQTRRAARIAKVMEWRRRHPEIHAESQRRRRAQRRLTAVARIDPAAVTAKLAYWGWRCWMCGGTPGTWDHVKPLSKNGPHLLANLRPACLSCNARKGSHWAGLAEVGSWRRTRRLR